MNREWFLPAKILTGICTLAVSLFSQSYTISAKPGAVNFIEGDVTINGDPVWTSNLKSTFLSAGDLIAVKNGRAEVLLTPGVFLRLGENSQVRMIKPSLIETQVELVSGESMIEVDAIVPGSSVAVLDHGASTTLVKSGLYRFTEHSIATLDGRAQVTFGERRIDLKKNKEVQIGDALRASKVDLSQRDDLYAWSNVRAQYAAAATYAGAQDVYRSGGFGFSSVSSPGWYWNSPFNSYMWMPANGAFYSPFGWGFYGPGVVSYAPVIACPYGNGWRNGGVTTAGGGTGTSTVVGAQAGAVRPPSQMIVPVSPRNPGVGNFQGNSPAAFAAARVQMQQVFATAGPRTASGAPAAALQNGQTFSNMRSASQAAASNAHANAASANSGGGWQSSGGSVMGAPAMSHSAPASAPAMSHSAPSGGANHK